jgi:hypothetical protein
VRKLIEFANLKKITYQSVESFLRRHGIYFTIDGEQRGYEKACYTKNSASKFLFEDAPDVEIQYRGAFLSRSPENELKMEACLKSSQREYREFLEACVRGGLPVDFVKDRISQFKGANLTVAPTDNPFRVSFELDLNPRDIETHVDIYEILYPAWNGEGDQFSRVKYCKNCSNFFCARSLKADFCSVKCKNAYNYRKKH